ncbi:MAG: enoyl-CoA hydratase-related protein [Rhodospirillales bacterium]
MSEPVVLGAVDSRGVATATLNRPQVHNAYNGDMVSGLAALLTGWAADDKVRVVVIRANGKHFQAGADLGWLREVSAADWETNLQVSRDTTNAMRGLYLYPKPTMAVVQGACYGGGTGIVASCDVVVASEDASFCISEVKWGVMPGPIVPQLNHAIGVRNVRRYALSSEPFNAEAALRMGMVHELAPRDDLDAAAGKVIDALLACGPDGVAQTKAVAVEMAGGFPEDLAERLAEQHARKRISAEAAEGLTSFQEKRKASWVR